MFELVSQILNNPLTCPIEYAEGNPQEMDGELYPQEDLLTKHAVPKRRREFVAGRILARQVLAKWGVQEFPLTVGKNREPLWPSGIIGSITHAHGYCAVAAGRRTDILGLGIDVEQIERVSEEIWSTICTPPELHFLNGLDVSDRQNYAALFFSAKESFYKCQYPLTQQWINFHDVSIRILDQENRYKIQLHKDLSGIFCKGRALEGRYFFDHGFAATTIILLNEGKRNV